MFKITIEGKSLQELAVNVLTMATQFETTAPEQFAPAQQIKPKRAAPKAVEPDEVLSAEDRALQAELAAPVEQASPTPVVDAGTGKPIAPVKLTVEDVKAAATKLASRDTPKLAELIKKHGGTKLSDLPPVNLGAFAGDVMEALG